MMAKQVRTLPKNQKYQNKTKNEFEFTPGLVIRVDSDDASVLTVFSDLTMKEFQVLAQDVMFNVCFLKKKSARIFTFFLFLFSVILQLLSPQAK